MPNLKIVALFVAALFTGAAYAASPTDGHIANHAYVNSYFHFEYAWPAMLKPDKLPSPEAGAQGAHAYMVPLFSARQGSQPYGVVVVAEKLHIAGPHSGGIQSSAEFIDRMAGSLRAGPILANISRSQKKGAQGMVFDKLSYTVSGKPASVMATQMGDYLIVFKCSAPSAAEIARLEGSALALRRLK